MTALDVLAIQIELAALTAKMHAVVAEMEGMKAANAERACFGASVAYDDRGFANCSAALEKISEEMRLLADNGGAA